MVETPDPRHIGSTTTQITASNVGEILEIDRAWQIYADTDDPSELIRLGVIDPDLE